MTLYRTITKNHKNKVIMRYDGNVYTVSYTLYGKHDVFTYSSYNHACYKFDIIHKEFLRVFSGMVLTSVK